MKSDEAMRIFIAEEAARRALAGQGTAALFTALRRLTTAQLLRDSTRPRALLPLPFFAAACNALQCSVRRRGGWLDFMVEGTPPAVALSPRLAAAALFSFVGSALAQPCAQVSIRLLGTADGAQLILRVGGVPGYPLAATEAYALFAAAAARGGGAALHTGAGTLCQGLWLPSVASPPLAQGGLCTDKRANQELASKPKATNFPTVQELLSDRYSLLHLYLAGFCAENFDL